MRTRIHFVYKSKGIAFGDMTEHRRQHGYQVAVRLQTIVLNRTMALSVR